MVQGELVAMRIRLLVILCALLAFAGCTATALADGSLERGFREPPDSCRPWVYWFWLNGNENRKGITADLEAMKRVGIGGVLIMEVDQGAPLGPVPFAGAKWRELFKFVCSEAHRLGLQVNMNGDAGWAGSGGPWITPDVSMLKLVWTETKTHGPSSFDGQLPPPERLRNFYRDITVLAYPTPGDYRIPDVEGKTGLVRHDFPPPTGDYPAVPAADTVPRGEVREIKEKMAPDGRLVWDVPPGNWTILRLGYTTTGAECEPAPQSGLGLECDKLSKAGSEAAFNGLVGKLASDVGPLAGKSFIRMHIDSWEVHSQNWTPLFREEFRQRRGYDPLPYMPAVTGHVVDSGEVSERFLWDYRQTVCELLADYYGGHMSELARRHGMGLSIEGYGDGAFDNMAYVGRADEPMAEYWAWPGNFTSGIVHQMASAAHVYGRPIVGAESFTSDNTEKWLGHPAAIKQLGDWAFCRGINRYVVHRYAMQPWTDRKPGMSMGPWGLHYERTQTWWEFSKPWHRYVARCQYMLRQGVPVADLLYVSPEGGPRDFELPADQSASGYGADGCPAEIVIKRLQLKNGRLCLPGGMSYRALVLPPATTMTPQLLRRVRALAQAGATIVGKLPNASPSLAGYPACDEEVRSLAASLSASGKILPADNPEKLLASKGLPPDFMSDRSLDYTHRRAGDTDIYFVANPNGAGVNATCAFRVTGKRPCLWDSETGRIEPIATAIPGAKITRLMLRLEASGSAFVVFRPAPPIASVVRLSRAGAALWPKATAAPSIEIVRAIWGPAGDPLHTKVVTEQVRRFINSGKRKFLVAELAAEGDPAVNVLKTLRVEFKRNGRPATASAVDSAVITFEAASDPPLPVRIVAGAAGPVAEAFAPGSYEAKLGSGRTARFRVASVPQPLDLTAGWTVSFPPHWGAPPRISMDRLASWSDSSDPGVRYFSGTATYNKTFTVPAGLLRRDRHVFLDLGRVEVMAQPTLNGKPLPILWKAPFVLDVTDTLRPGRNTLTVRVVNLWPNRLIGDEQLPEDSKRYAGGNLVEWPSWLQEDKPSPTGRFTFGSWRLYDKNSKLLPSGLLGPVALRTVVEVPLSR